MANGQVTVDRSRPLGVPASIVLFTTLFLAAFGLGLSRSPQVVLALLVAGVGVTAAFSRPDWFIYFILFTLEINFSRVIYNFPAAIEETYILAMPLVILHRFAGGRIVRRLRLRSAYLWPVLGILALTASLHFRGQDIHEFLKTMGRTVEAVSVGAAILSVATSWERQRKMIYSLLAGAVVICIVIIIQFVVGGPTWFYFFVRGTTATSFSELRVDQTVWAGRGMGFGGPAGSAVFLEMLVPLALYRLLAAKRKFWHYATLAGTWIGILLTFTIAPILSSIGASALLFMSRRKFGWKSVLAIAFTAGVGLVILRQPTVERQLVGHFETVRRDESYNRLDRWKIGLHLFAEHPLAGVGPKVDNQVLRQIGLFWQASGFYRDPGIYNTYINIAATYGLLGLICYGWIIFRTLQLGLRCLRHRSLGPRRFEVIALACAFVAWLVSGLVFSFTLDNEMLVILILLESTYYLVRADRTAALAAGAKGTGDDQMLLATASPLAATSTARGRWDGAVTPQSTIRRNRPA